jgi:rhamnopyranosyl-N-acetylglucosaminyl-diphospho-decaprenol beta-1,3/1,4-galactofuranosyltransferase
VTTINVIGVVVTQNELISLQDLMVRFNALQLERVVIVINTVSESSIEDSGKFRIIRTGVNLGGAGGFARGMMEALKLNPSWIWTCDDDALPELNSIVGDLVETAHRSKSDLVAPIIVSPTNFTRLSFPYRKNFRRLWNRDQVVFKGLIQKQAHLFNGCLFSASMIKEVGFPDFRLFIRGDEQEFLFRIIKSGYSVVTDTNSVMIHPSGENELHPTLFGLLRAPVPSTPMKFSYQLRNRGYLVRKYRRLDWFFVDFVRYTSFFLFQAPPHPSAYCLVVKIYFSGFLQRIDHVEIVDSKIWKKIQILTRNST